MELTGEQPKRLQQQFDFIREIDKEKEIIRQTPLADNSRKEDDNINFGRLFGVGVGPGDPELLTLKAVHAIEQADIIAFPGRTKEESTAYSIPINVVSGYVEKTAVPVELPMTKDPEELKTNHENAAELLEKYLKKGKKVAFLTLGDPSFYSTYAYIDEKVRADGFETEIIPGVPSFSAIAAKLQMPIALGSEAVKIQTGLNENFDTETENLVILKAGRNAGKIRDCLKAAGYKAAMVSSAGMSNEKVYPTIEDIPETEGYFSLILAKKVRRTENDDLYELAGSAPGLIVKTAAEIGYG